MSGRPAERSEPKKSTGSIGKNTKREDNRMSQEAQGQDARPSGKSGDSFKEARPAARSGREPDWPDATRDPGDSIWAPGYDGGPREPDPDSRSATFRVPNRDPESSFGSVFTSVATE